MAEQKEGKQVNVPKNETVELPCSEEEGRMEIPIPSSPIEEGETPSNIEDDLLRSSGRETEGGPKSPPMDKSTWESQRRERKRLQNRLRRTKRRKEERQARHEERLMEGASTQQEGSSQAKPSEARPSKTPAGKQAVNAQSEPGSSSPSLERADSQLNGLLKASRSYGEEGVEGGRREAKRQSFMLPTASASVRGVGEPGSSQEPSSVAPRPGATLQELGPGRTRLVLGDDTGCNILKVDIGRLEGNGRGRRQLPRFASS